MKAIALALAVALVAGAVAGFLVTVLVLQALASGSAETDTLGVFVAFPAGLLAALAAGGAAFVVALRRLRRARA